MRSLVLPVALLLGALEPSAASAETTITYVGGIEVIVTQPDAPPNRIPNAPHPARVAGPQVPALEGRPDAGATDERNGAVSRDADALIRTAMSLVGTRYVWGGSGTGGFDCSGFVYYTYARLGIHIPRTADKQFAAGRPVAGDPQPGDLVFFQTYDYGASHVGIYLGNGQFVNAIGKDVHVASFASPYFRSRYLGARRFLPA